MNPYSLSVLLFGFGVLLIAILALVRDCSKITQPASSCIKKLAEMKGGKILVHSREGEGTTFRLTLPRA